MVNIEDNWRAHPFSTQGGTYPSAYGPNEVWKFIYQEEFSSWNVNIFQNTFGTRLSSTKRIFEVDTKVL